jgi:hypothetical protein
MAINVNTVYRTVLLILNKEQRGMLTPDEFNKVATQVQLEIFEGYFNTLDLQVRKPDNITEYGDKIKNTNQDISIFKEYGDCTFNAGEGKFILPTGNSNSVYSQTFTGVAGQSSYTFTSISAAQLLESTVYVYIDNILQPTNAYIVSGSSITFNASPSSGSSILVNAKPNNFYTLGSVFYKDEKELQLVQRNELPYLKGNPLVAPSISYPVFLYENNKIQVLPSAITSDITISYLRKPMDVRWNFTVPTGQAYYSYSPTGSIDFEISKKEQSNIVTRILLYAGVVVKDPSIIQVAQQQVQAETIKETL